MQFAALFIEYFVTGVTAFAWLLPLFGVQYSDLANLEPQAFIFVPVAYVLGHIIDVISSTLLTSPKASIRKWVRKQEGYDKKNKKYGSEPVFLMYVSPEVSKYLSGVGRLKWTVQP